MPGHLVDILLGLQTVLLVLLLFLSAIPGPVWFGRAMLGAVLLELAGHAALVWAAVGELSGGEAVSAFGNYLVGGGNYIAGWIMLLVPYLLYAVTMTTVFRNPRLKECVGFKMHRRMTWISALFVFLVLPAAVFGAAVFAAGMAFVDGFRVSTLIAVGYGTPLLRLEMLRTLVLGSFWHRHLVVEDAAALQSKEKRFNGWAFLFGVRWYFYKGLLGKGALLMIPYVLTLIPGIPREILLLFAVVGTRIYCGLKGNADYFRLKTAAGAPLSN